MEAISENAIENKSIMVYYWDWGVDISLIYIIALLLIYIISKLWFFIDDQETPVGYGLSICRGTFFCTILLLSGGVVVGLSVIAYKEIFSQIPVIYYLWVGGSGASIWFMRYARRTHKVLHTHMKDKNAHK